MVVKVSKEFGDTKLSEEAVQALGNLDGAVAAIRLKNGNQAHNVGNAT